jgi:hypothetical protein
MDLDAFIFDSEHKVDTICTLDLHVYSHLDPMDTIWTKRLHECGHQEVVAIAYSEDALAMAVAECGSARQCAPPGDPMPSPRRTAVGLHRREECGGFSIENDKEGSASPTAAKNFEFAARVENCMPTAHGGNHMPKIPDVADKIEVLHAAKSNLEELRRGAGLNQLQIAHLPHPPTR